MSVRLIGPSGSANPLVLVTHRAFAGVFGVGHEASLGGLPVILRAAESKNLHGAGERSRALLGLILKRNVDLVRIVLVAIHNQ